MYFYLYDSFLNNKKYTTVLAKIENRLIDLGINGKIEKMSILKNMKEMVEDNVKGGAKTIIAVGNDKTFFKVFSVIARQNGITFGFIPIGESIIAKSLGIPSAEKACDVLSARITEKIDLGKVNNHYFFSTLEIPGSEQLTLECNSGRFRISSVNQNDLIQICNLTFTPTSRDSKTKKICNPKDGLLEAIFTPLQKNILGKNRLDFNKRSVFPIKKLKIKSDNSVSLIADGETVVKTPVTVEVAPKKFRLIVGKERKF